MPGKGRPLNIYLFSMLLAILASASYHLLAKAIPQTVNPAIVLILTYSVGILLSLGLMVTIFPLQGTFEANLRQITPPMLLLGLAVVGIEMGFVLAYRAGWNTQVAPLVSNLSVALLLLPVGALLFKEQITLVNLIGFGICVVGLILVNLR